jgi:hypothetical protein
MRALARLTLAKLEVTAGRWRAAKTQLDSLQAIDYPTGIEHRAHFALARFLAVPRSELEALRDTVLRWDAAAPGSPDTTGLLGSLAGLHPYLRLYLLGLLNARMGDTAAALSYASQLQRLSPRSHAPTFVGDLGRVVRMEVASADGSRTHSQRSRVPGFGRASTSRQTILLSWSGCTSGWPEPNCCISSGVGRRRLAGTSPMWTGSCTVAARPPCVWRSYTTGGVNRNRRRDTMRASFGGGRTATQNCDR